MRPFSCRFIFQNRFRLGWVIPVFNCWKAAKRLAIHIVPLAAASAGTIIIEKCPRAEKGDMDVMWSDWPKRTRIKVIQQLRNLVIGDSGYRGKKLDMAGRAAIPTVSYHQISQLLYYFNSGSFWSIASHHIHITFFCPWAFSIIILVLFQYAIEMGKSEIFAVCAGLRPDSGRPEPRNPAGEIWVVFTCRDDCSLQISARSDYTISCYRLCGILVRHRNILVWYNVGCFHMSRWLFHPNFSPIGLHRFEL